MATSSPTPSPTPTTPTSPSALADVGGRQAASKQAASSANKSSSSPGSGRTTAMGVGDFVDSTFANFERAYPAGGLARPGPAQLPPLAGRRKVDTASGLDLKDGDGDDDDDEENEFDRPVISPATLIITLCAPLLFLLYIGRAELFDAFVYSYYGSSAGYSDSSGSNDQYSAASTGLLHSLLVGHALRLILALVILKPGPYAKRFGGWLVWLCDGIGDWVCQTSVWRYVSRTGIGESLGDVVLAFLGDEEDDDDDDDAAAVGKNNSSSSSSGGKSGGGGSRGHQHGNGSSNNHRKAAKSSATTGPPQVLTVLAIVTALAFLVHPDGFTWIVLGKVWDGIQFVLGLPGHCIVLVRDGSISTVTALASLGGLVLLLRSLRHYLLLLSGGESSERLRPSSQSRPGGSAKSHRGKKGKKGRGRQGGGGGGGTGSGASGTRSARGRGRIRNGGGVGGGGGGQQQQSSAAACHSSKSGVELSPSSRDRTVRSGSTSPGGLKTPSREPYGDDAAAPGGNDDLEGALLQRVDGQELTNGERKLLNNRRKEAGAPASLDKPSVKFKDEAPTGTDCTVDGSANNQKNSSGAITGRTRSGRRKRRGKKIAKQASKGSGGDDDASDPASGGSGGTGAAAPPPQAPSTVIAQPKSAYLPGVSQQSIPYKNSPISAPSSRMDGAIASDYASSMHANDQQGLPQSRLEAEMGKSDSIEHMPRSVNGLPLFSRLSSGGGSDGGPASIGGKQLYYMPNPVSSTNTNRYYPVPNYASSYTYSQGVEGRYTPGKIELAALLAQVGLVGAACASLLADVPDVDALTELTDEELESYNIAPEKRAEIGVMLDARRKRQEEERREQPQPQPLLQPKAVLKPQQVAIRPPPGLDQSREGYGMVDSSPGAVLGSQQHELPFLSMSTLSSDVGPSSLLHEALNAANVRNRCYSAGESSFSGTSVNDNLAKVSTPTLSPLPRSFIDMETTLGDEGMGDQDDKIEADLQELGGQMAGMLFD